MDIIRFSELSETPWKNGDGITRNIAQGSLDGVRLWRLSRAEVTCDGPFSNFAGLIRILTVTEGAGMVLESPEENVDADLWSPVRFDGALPVQSSLKDGPLSDLNLMFDPNTCVGDVVLLQGPANHELAPKEGRLMALYGLAGTVQLSAGDHLLPGDTALIKQGANPINLRQPDAALLVTLDLKPQIDWSKVEITTR